MNKFCILLTTCVNLKNIRNEYIFNKNGSITSISGERKKLYEKVINFYLENTDIDIYCVESSGNHFNINNEKFKCLSIDVNDIKTSSEGEILSILYAREYFKKEWKRKNITHIIKITGKYVLNTLKLWFNKDETLIKNYDIWVQDVGTEIFVWKISLIKEILKDYEGELFEDFMYKIINSNKYIYARLPKFKNVLKSVRADGSMLEYL